VLLQSIDRTGLLLKDQRRSADSLPLEVDSYLALIHVPAINSDPVSNKYLSVLLSMWSQY
jgi:hypothetical protein